jgi:tRNA pseudouridine55 synthase
MDGALLIDKPGGLTSHDVVACVRRALATPRIGHTGTLDPLATGLLVLLVGRATRLSQFLVADEKEYLAGIRLGVSTPTYDREGLPGHSQLPTSNSHGMLVRDLPIDAVLDAFRGTFLQMPPPYSAKKVGGVRAYTQARKNRPVDLTPVEVTIKQLETLPSDDPMLLRLRVVSSSGFYVRSLAHDIGQRLGCGAYLETLRRTRAGAFRVEEALPLDVVQADPARGEAALLPPERLIGHVPALRLSPDGCRRAAHGNEVAPRHLADGNPAGGAGPFQLLDPEGRLVAVAERGADAILRPVVVLV